MSADEEIERLMQRTRARREKLNTHRAAIGEPERPIRSPLKEKNDTPSVRGRSPIKTTYSSPSKIAKTSPSKVQSPIRTGTFKIEKKTEVIPSTSTSIHRVYEEKDGSSRSE